MKKRLVLIAVLAACFGWGFSALVDLSDRTIRPANASLGCQDRSACSQALMR